MHTDKYTLRVTVDRHTVDLVERAASDHERTLILRVDGAILGDIHLLTCYLPSIAVGPSDVVIAGGTRLYLTSLTGGTVTRFDLDDEVHAAYSLDQRWLLVCETSVAMFDPSERGDVPHYLHDEILLDS